MNTSRKQSRASAPWAAKALPDGSYEISRADCACVARLIAPQGSFPERAAVSALMDFAACKSAGGLSALAAAGTPDLHPNHPIPVGSVLLAPEDMAIPAAIGRDIGCGMRLVRFDIPAWEARERLDALAKALREPFLEARRDAPLTGAHFAALFEEGPMAVAKMGLPQEGLWRAMDPGALERDFKASACQGLFHGSSRFVPECLLADRMIREPGFGTLGSGNHFFELQSLDWAIDPKACWERGIDKASLYGLIHTGSRDVGQFVGSSFMSRAKAAWPKGRAHPPSGVFCAQGALARDCLAGMGAASHYAWLNRGALQEMARQALGRALGREVRAACVADAPHNVATRERGGVLHRKGAAPAWDGALCLIPGSMGDYSFAAVGAGSEATLSSCSHGAGRSARRSAARALSGQSKLPFRIETLNGARFMEERPAAYMDIEPAMDIQSSMGIAYPCARFAPMATFKA